METSEVLQLLALFILLLLSVFLSSAEAALDTVSQTAIRALEEQGNKRAVTVNKVLTRRRKMTSSLLIGHTLSLLGMAALATILVSNRFGDIYVVLGILILSILVLLFSEVMPRNWGRNHPEKLSLTYGRNIWFLMKLLTPVIFLADKISYGLMRLLHIDIVKKNPMTETELKSYVDVSHEDGVIESEEREIIYNIFDFADALARDIMIPRINMVSVNIDASYEELHEIFRESMYTRIPVYKEDPDAIVGLVNIKDFLLTADRENFHISSILRDAYYTYEFKKISDLLFEMRGKSMNVAFVLNEYGAAEGMITLEDLLEEIVGEIRDEFDEDEEELIQELEENTYLVEGSLKLDDLNDALGTHLESEDYDSIGGMIIEALDRLPEDGEEVTLDNGISLKVQGIDQNRIMKVLMILPEPAPEDEDLEETLQDIDL